MRRFRAVLEAMRASVVQVLLHCGGGFDQRKTLRVIRKATVMANELYIHEQRMVRRSE
jgi:hypothetical protein